MLSVKHDHLGGFGGHALLQIFHPLRLYFRLTRILTNLGLGTLYLY